MGFDTIKQNWEAMVSDLKGKQFNGASKSAATAQKIVEECHATIGSVVEDLTEIAMQATPKGDQKEGLKQVVKVLVFDDVVSMLADAEDRG